MKNLSTTKIFELFFNLNIDIKELIEMNHIDIKCKEYLEKVSFHKVYNGQNIAKDIYAKNIFGKRDSIIVKKGNPVAFYKSLNDGMEEAKNDTLNKIIYLNSDSPIPFNAKLRENCKIVHNELVETKRGYALKVKINEKINLQEAINRRLRYMTVDKNSVKYNYKEKTFSFNFLRKNFIYNSNLSELSLSQLINSEYEDFFVFLNENHKDIQRVYKTKLSCEPIAHKWTILKTDHKESVLESISQGYFAKDAKVLDLTDDYILIFEYCDLIRNIPYGCEKIHNFKDILDIDGINEIDSDYNGYSRCVITHTNKIKVL